MQIEINTSTACKVVERKIKTSLYNILINKFTWLHLFLFDMFSFNVYMY